MLSKVLKERALFKKKCELKADAPDFIGETVRQLVICMRLHEISGIMSREQLERCVIKAFEDAESVYYTMDDEMLMAVAKLEMKNEEIRSKARR